MTLAGGLFSLFDAVCLLFDAVFVVFDGLLLCFDAVLHLSSSIHLKCS